MRRNQGSSPCGSLAVVVRGSGRILLVPNDLPVASDIDLLAIRIGDAMTLPTVIWYLKSFLAAVLVPPLMPLLLIAAGLLLLPLRQASGRGLAWGGVLVALLLSTPISVSCLTAPLEDIPVLRQADLSRGQAIVILGGGRRKYTPEYGQPTPNRLSLERLRYGARVARRSGLPILISGGGSPERWAEARLMADALGTDFGVRTRWIESQSINTEENALFSAVMLKAEGIRRIVLVTHAAHMHRALREFESQGIEAIAAPMGFFTEPGLGDDLRDFVPGPTAALAAWYAIHEWLGLLAQTARLGIR